MGVGGLFFPKLQRGRCLDVLQVTSTLSSSSHWTLSAPRATVKDECDFLLTSCQRGLASQVAGLEWAAQGGGYLAACQG